MNLMFWRLMMPALKKRMLDRQIAAILTDAMRWSDDDFEGV